MKNITKISKAAAKILTTAALMSTIMAGSALAEPKFDTTSSAPIVSVEDLNNAPINKKMKKVYTADQIPTVAEVNEALKTLNVSDVNPYQIVDLGNGFTIEAGGSNAVQPSDQIGTNVLQNTTATGYYRVNALGVKLYDISVSASYSYDDKTNEIKSVQNPISANASGGIGWVGEITQKKAYKIDNKAWDLIADANYSYIKLIGNYAGHIEVRFTGTGNWYMHDTYIGDSHY
ncbi:hypothetical protein [Paenibacillus silvae]|uniref:hypothetical protein n=1 Tax=Paenibacillus silvae TaxID=1325358 RepID=UPI0011A3D698|nr:MULTISPECIES: hypothetical protein [Paenibacillus]MCK6073601.1 hypothetical protein [Paenibacillus silvae]MCK6148923.1 hypothetical protein [Paenibacillus silvae]MCK6267222.1 hypothetical protein [Paenibacillus silvae]